MAEKLQITTSAYCLYENGKRSIPKEAVAEIIKILQIPENEANKIFLPKSFAICKTNEKVFCGKQNKGV